MTYYKPTGKPSWMTDSYATYVTGEEAKYDWNAVCSPGVDFEHCISTQFQEDESLKKEEALSFCIDYCFEDDTPAILTPEPTFPDVTLQPTPMPTPFPTTPFPTYSPTPKPTFGPTIQPTAFPTYMPTPIP